MNIIKFSKWLEIREGKFVSKIRPEMDPDSIKKIEASIGDIVELGPESEHMGKKVTRVGQVVEKRPGGVLVRDLTKINKNYEIKYSDLYDKEELKGILLTPGEERELKMLGGKKLWVRLSPRQYKKFKSQYQVKMKPIIGSGPTDAAPSRTLKQMFSTQSSEPEPAPMKIFEPERREPTSPLKKFIKKDLF